MTSTESSVVILSCSLNPTSRSHKLAQAAQSFLRDRRVPVELVDLAEHDLPLCGGEGSFDHPSVKTLTGIIESAGAILVSSPVYNYDLNAAAKNVMELTGSGWTEKPVGFLCAAGGRSSYMSPIGFANSLMFDFRCLIIPRFVYCTKTDFTESGELGPEIATRVEQLAAAAVDLARAFAWVRANGVGDQTR
jgi:FMN reductase